MSSHFDDSTCTPYGRQAKNTERDVVIIIIITGFINKDSLSYTLGLGTASILVLA